MELYILDNQLKNERVIEGYESAIWTDRFHEAGDFEIVFPIKETFTDSLSNGTYIGCDISDRIMRVDTREFTRDEDGRVHLKVSGESLESILKYRIAWKDRTAAGINDQFVMEGPIKEIVVRMLRRAGFSPNNDDPAFDGSIDLNSSLWTGPKATFDRAGYPVCTIPEPGDGIIVKDSPMTTYDYILEICKAYNIGYRMLRQPGHNPTFAILVHVYQGRDLTLSQTADRPVVFSSKHDNLENESMIDTVRGHYEGVWVWEEDEDSPGRTGVFLPNYGNVAPDATGLDMRTGFVVSSPPEDATNAQRVAHRQQLGEEFLNENSAKVVVDGEITQNSQYKYGVDYHLGDRVELMTQFNYSSHMRVTEQIFTADADGVRSYPTLSDETLVNQDSWMAQSVSRIWDTATGHWATE